MGAAGLPYVVDGSEARLSPRPNASLAVGPGQLGRAPALAMLFEAGAGIRNQDLFAAFWRDEAPGMTWFADFLCDPAMDEFLFRLANPPEEEEEEEMLYSKAQLTMLGSDVMDDY